MSFTIPLDLWTHHILNYTHSVQLFELIYINKEFYYNLTDHSINNPTSIRFNYLKNFFTKFLSIKNYYYNPINEYKQNNLLNNVSNNADLICFLILRKEYYYLQHLCTFLIQQQINSTQSLKTTEQTIYPIKWILQNNFKFIWENKKLTKNLIAYNNNMINNVKKEWLHDLDMIAAIIEGSSDCFQLYKIFNPNYIFGQYEIPFPTSYDPKKIFTKNNLNLLKLALKKCNIDFFNIPHIKQLIDDLIYNDLNMEIMSLVIHVNSDTFSIKTCSQKLEELYGSNNFINISTMTINLLCKILKEYNGFLIQYISDKEIKNNIEIIKSAIQNNFLSFILINKEMKENENVLNELVIKSRRRYGRVYQRESIKRCLELFQNKYLEECYEVLVYFYNKRRDLRYCKEMKEAFHHLKEETFLGKVLPKLELFGKKSKSKLIVKLLPKRYFCNEIFVQKIITIKPELEKTIIACKKYLNIK